MKKRMFYSLFFAFMLVITPALVSAASLTLDLDIAFGSDPLGGTGPWVVATFEDTDTDEVTLTVATSGLVDDEILTGFYFNIDPALDPAADVTVAYSSGLQAIGVDQGTDGYKADGDGWHDFRLDYATSGTVFDNTYTSTYVLTGTGLDAYDFNYWSRPGGGAGIYLAVAKIQRVDINGDDNAGSNWVGAPEPSTLLLLGTGLLGIAITRRRKIV